MALLMHKEEKDREKMRRHTLKYILRQTLRAQLMNSLFWDWFGYDFDI